MPDVRLTVLISQGQSRSPDKRQLEVDVAETAAKLPGVQVIVAPHLYDAPKDGETFRTLRGIDNDLIVLSWLFERATHWVLDRNGVRGQVGEVLLKNAEAEADDEEELATEEEPLTRVTDEQPRPDRHVYCIDLRASLRAQDFLSEIARISELRKAQAWVRGQVSAEALERFAQPTNTTYVGSTHVDSAYGTPTLLGLSGLLTIDEHPSRRWYPVIDFSRCTNCMECIDFCLFGVYGVDSVETIVVEQPDNCRKGCPACSRVCPQNAIIFPQHKTPAIAGAPLDAGGLKIDLSKLFGAPDGDEDALAIAAKERDEQLILAGREAVGISQGIRERLGSGPRTSRDDLDSLIDQLDSLDL